MSSPLSLYNADLLSQVVASVEVEVAGEPGYELVVEPIAVNGSFHTHWYPRLGRRFAAVEPDVVHVEEEPYNLATLQAVSLAVLIFGVKEPRLRRPPVLEDPEAPSLG